MPYLRNTWYMAAWSHELGEGAVLARRFMELPVALYRQQDGKAVALLDRCPHRFAPLSMGSVRGDQIVCRYHGLGFDGSGACRTNPHGPIPQRLVVRAFPLAEAHRAIWIWMGDPQRADPALIPDLSYLAAAPESAFSCGYLHNHGNYEIYVDNILDLSHTDFLHPTTLGSAGLTGTRPEVIETEDHIEVTWMVRNGTSLPLLRQLIPALPEKTDTWTRVRWHAPGVMKLVVGTVGVGAPESGAALNHNAHVLTPDSADSCHYFFAATRNFATGDLELNARMAQTRQRIFETEDKPMIEAVQRNMGDAEFWSLNPLMLPVDAAPVRVRRRLQALIEAESKNYERGDSA